MPPVKPHMRPTLNVVIGKQLMCDNNRVNIVLVGCEYGAYSCDFDPSEISYVIMNRVHALHPSQPPVVQRKAMLNIFRKTMKLLLHSLASLSLPKLPDLEKIFIP